jgi:hypothetical protein
MDPITAEAVYVHPEIFLEGKKHCVQIAIMVDRGQGKMIETLLMRCKSNAEAVETRDQIAGKVKAHGKCLIFSPAGIPLYKPKKGEK